MIRLILLTLALSMPVSAGEFILGVYAEKLNKESASHVDYSPDYDGYKFPVETTYIDSNLNNSLKYFSVEYANNGYSAKGSTYSDVNNYRAYTASIHKSLYTISNVNIKVGIGADLNKEFKLLPSLSISYDKFFIVPSIEADKNNISLVVSFKI